MLSKTNVNLTTAFDNLILLEFRCLHLFSRVSNTPGMRNDWDMGQSCQAMMRSMVETCKKMKSPHVWCLDAGMKTVNPRRCLDETNGSQIAIPLLPPVASYISTKLVPGATPRSAGAGEGGKELIPCCTKSYFHGHIVASHVPRCK